MEAIFTLAGKESLDVFLDMRLEFIAGLGKDSAADPAMREASKAYFEGLIAEGNFQGFLCSLGEETVSVLGILGYALPPLAGSAPRKVAHVLNVYTKPPYRGRGYATELLKMAIGWAREKGYDRVFLNATAEGEPLYRRLGFKEQEEKALVLKLA